MNFIPPPPTRTSFVTPTGTPEAAWVQWISTLEQLFNKLQGTGTTAQRPNPPPFIGFMFYDTTINRPIWARSATVWVYADGTTA